MTCVPAAGTLPGPLPGASVPDTDAFAFGASPAAMRTFTNLALLWSLPAMAAVVLTGEMMGEPFRR